MSAALRWSAETPDLFVASAEVGRRAARVFLVAEIVPSGGWDWTAWSVRGRGPSLHGSAGSRTDAMRMAESAALSLLVPAEQRAAA